MRNILILTLTLISSTCLGQVDGKGLMCEYEGGPIGLDGLLRFFRFDSFKIHGQSLIVDRDVISLSAEEELGDYFTTEDVISWSTWELVRSPKDLEDMKSNMNYYRLSRKNLVLESKIESELTSRFYNCEVYSNLELLRREIEARIDGEQAQYNERIKDNLI